MFTNFDCRCYADELANKTISEIREIYANYENPSCTKYRNVEIDTQLSNDLYKNDTEFCNQWIYEFDHGYQSMSSEVSILKFDPFIQHINIFFSQCFEFILTAKLGM